MGRPRYFTPAEVAAHNTAEDLWVSFLGKVCDLTPLVSRYGGERGVRKVQQINIYFCVFNGINTVRLHTVDNMMSQKTHNIQKDYL